METIKNIDLYDRQWWRYPQNTECGKRCYHVKASQFARNGLSCLYMGLIVVRIRVKKSFQTKPFYLDWTSSIYESKQPMSTQYNGASEYKFTV